MSATSLAGPANSESSQTVRMMLFIADAERNSQAARANLARICEQHLAGRADVEVVDVLVSHRKALEWRVMLTPALLIFNAARPTRITGTLEEPKRILSVLGLCEKAMTA